MAVGDDREFAPRVGPGLEGCDQLVGGGLAVDDDAVGTLEERTRMKRALRRILRAIVPEEVVGRPDDADARAAGEAQLQQRPPGLQPADPSTAAM